MQKNHTQKIIISLLIAVPFMVWFGVLSNGLVWDDIDIYLNENKFDKNAELDDLLHFWDPTYQSGNNMYMPITYSVWFVAGKISGSNGKINFDSKLLHSINLIVHIINGILVFYILLYFLKDNWISFAGALLFSVHPIQVEAVAWVSELRGLLAAFFGFLSILYFLKYVDKNSVKLSSNYILSILFFVLSMLSKPSGVSFSLLIIITALFFSKFGVKKALFITLPYLILVIPVALRANAAESEMPYVFGGPIWVRPLVYLDSVTFYLKNIIFPLDLAADYGRKPQFVMNTTFFYFSWIIPIVIGGFLFLKRYNMRVIQYSFIFFIIAFITVSGLVSFYFQDWSTVADRYIYVSMLAVSLSFGYLIKKLNDKMSKIITTAVAVIFALLTMQQIKVWESEMTLWDNNISKYPDRSAHAYTGRGYLYMQKGQFNPALMDFNKAIELNPKYNRAYYNRANIYYDAGEFSKAISDFSKAIELSSKNPNYYNNRGLAYSDNNQTLKAIVDYNSALELDSMQYDVYINRGVSFASLQRWSEAKDDFSRALDIKPNDSRAIQYIQMVNEEITKEKNK